MSLLVEWEWDFFFFFKWQLSMMVWREDVINQKRTGEAKGRCELSGSLPCVASVRRAAQRRPAQSFLFCVARGRIAPTPMPLPSSSGEGGKRV